MFTMSFVQMQTFANFFQTNQKRLFMIMNLHFRGYPLFFKFFSFMLAAALFTNSAFAQTTVTGKVTDAETKAPLSNVSVIVKGSKAGVVTDNAGVYTIAVPAGSKLLFSYLGGTPDEQNVTASGVLNVSLSTRPKSMDEVVVIGYGSRKKKDVTGAISTIGAKDIERSTAMTPELALQGTAAGVFIESGGGAPGARPTVRIRGVNTFGFSEPLYVIDGVPIIEGGAGATGGAIGDIRSPLNIYSLINPADIETMTVLKDASAAAIYGVRASNGVILITTKKGKSGRARVEFASSYGVQNIAKTQTVLNTQQYFSLLKESYANNPDGNGSVSFATKFGPLYNEANSQYVGNAPTYNWQNELLNKNAPLQDYNVKVSGGSDATTYYFSAGYAKTESPLKANELERFSMVSNIESRISKYLSAGMNIRLVSQNALENTNASLTDMMSTIPFQPFYDKNDITGFVPTGAGNLIPNPAYDPARLAPGAPFIFDAAGSRLLWGQQTRYNAFALQSLNKRTYDMQNLLGNVYVQIEPLAGLRIKGSLSGNYYLNFRKEFEDNDSWRFKQPVGNPFGATQDPFAKGSLGERNTRTTNLNKEVTASYNRTFLGDHNVDVVLSGSEQTGRWYVSDLSGQVNFTNPQYWSIGNRPPNVNGFSNILSEDVLIGYMGRLSYKFKDKYYFDATIRRDGSSRLSPENKFQNFPSFAAAWRISGEEFFPKIRFLDDLKLRGGWGKLGNFQSAGYYKYLTTVSGSPDYAFGSGVGNGVGTPFLGAALPGFANNTLTWEKIKTSSFGFDAVMFNNHVNFTAEYYNKVTYDIIQSVSPPPNTGIQENADLNVATVRNRGIELQLSYNQKFGNVNFNASANLTTVNNKVLRLNGGTPIGGQGGRIEEGYSMFYLWGYKVGGVFQNQAEIDTWRKKQADKNIGQDTSNISLGYQYKPGDMYFQDVNGNPRNSKERFRPGTDSLVNSNDRTFLGKTIPGYYYGFSFGADYKGFDVSVFFQGVGDVKKYNYIRAGLEGMGGPANQFATTLDRWTVAKPSSTMPRAVFGDPANTGRFSSRFVESAAYLRLKNVQLGYTLPKQILSKSNLVQNLRFYVSAVNVFTITKYTGLDPENEFLPPTRQTLVGLNVTF